jgi:hypothetical protein
MKLSSLVLGILASVLAFASGCATRPAVTHRALVGEPWRVLVDKVLMKDNGWVMTEDHIREMREAGFNVVSPRLGGEDMDRVRKVATMAGKYDMYYLAWMRGSLGTKTGLKYVYPDGHDCDIYSPNADELWDWMTETIVAQAQVSVEVPAMVGVFLDYENYGHGKAGNCYGLSYDSKILREFALAIEVAIPEMPAAQRHDWLQKHGLLKAFEKFQIRSWQRRARELRRRVDEINPEFLFVLYPAPGTLLMTSALYAEWATPRAPLVLADASTYGRPAEFMAQAESLLANRQRLMKGMLYARKRGIPHVYLGGIDPVCPGADPEFCGKNAAMISAVSDGYWIFYEGPEYRQDHPAYFAWFKKANEQIATGLITLQNEPRSEPENLGRTKVDRKTDKIQLAVYNGRKLLQKDLAGTGLYEIHKLEGMSLEYLQQLDGVILQNYNVPLAADHAISRNLRAYVEGGGGVLFGHDTAWFMESVFPEIAVRDNPKHNVEAERHVVDRELVVATEHPALAGLAKGTTFQTEFRDHMIFKPGPEGTVVVRNRFGDPVYVIGKVGNGHVVYAGCYYGYEKPLSGAERELVLALVRWLVRKGI